MAETYFVSLDLYGAETLAYKVVLRESRSGGLKDKYSIQLPEKGTCLVYVFEKYYMRVGNYLTLTMVLDDFCGKTRVHTAGGGGKDSARSKGDWGAAEKFEDDLKEAFAEYIV